MEQDRRYREEQEQQLLALEEERRNYERLLRCDLARRYVHSIVVIGLQEQASFAFQRRSAGIETGSSGVIDRKLLCMIAVKFQRLQAPVDFQ